MRLFNGHAVQAQKEAQLSVVQGKRQGKDK
jgi:hypothetical protein